MAALFYMKQIYEKKIGPVLNTNKPYPFDYLIILPDLVIPESATPT